MELDAFVWPDGTVRTLDSSFPVLLARPGGTTIDPVRAAVVEHPDGPLYFLAWAAGGPTGGELIENRELSSVNFENGSVTMTTTDGLDYSYGRSGGCGCGNRLRSYTAWPGKRVLAMARTSR